MSRVITEKVEITDKMLKPSKRLVDANALEVVGTVIPSGIDEKSYVMGMEYILNKIDSMPTIEERKKGKWITHDYKINGLQHAYCECTVCGGERPITLFPLNYCPNCGARMESGA